MRIGARFALLAPDELAADVVVEVHGDRIAHVERGRSTPCDTHVDLLAPGFADVHGHAFHRCLRGRARLGNDFWDWRASMLALAEILDPDRYRTLATLVYRELLLGGYTTVGEFHYLHHTHDGSPYENPNAMGLALVEAARAARCRFTLIDAAYLHQAPHGGDWTPVEGVLRRFADATVDTYLERTSELAESQAHRVQLAGHSLRTCSPEELTAISQAAERGWHLHLAEQQLEVEIVEAALGERPVAVLEHAGLLSPQLVAVHANAATSEELDSLARHDVVLCACPSTEEDLGDGPSPAAAYGARGGRVAIGSDEHVLADGLVEASRLDAHARLATRQRHGLDVPALWSALTAHHALGWPEAGRIAPGMLADLVAIDLDDVSLAGVAPAATIAVTAPARVERVWVGGHEIVHDAAEERRELAHQLDHVIRAIWKEIP